MGLWKLVLTDCQSPIPNLTFYHLDNRCYRYFTNFQLLLVRSTFYFLYFLGISKRNSIKFTKVVRNYIITITINYLQGGNALQTKL